MSDLRVGYGVTIPEAELTVRASRSSGPGGQNVNRRATRVEVVFDLEGSDSIPPDLKRRARRRLGRRVDAAGRIRVVSQAERTQRANRDVARERLAGLLREAIAPPPKTRRATKPTKTALERRLADKRARGVRKRLRRPPTGED